MDFPIQKFHTKIIANYANQQTNQQKCNFMAELISAIIVQYTVMLITNNNIHTYQHY